MEQTKPESELYAALDEYIGGLADKRGALIATLHKAQELFGYLPKEVQNHVAHRLQIPSSRVFGVITFYSFFHEKKRGANQVNVCLGTACYVRGAKEVLDGFARDVGVGVGETTEDGLFSIDALRCVGACGLAPVVSVNGKVYGRVGAKDVRKIVEEHMAEGSGADG